MFKQLQMFYFVSYFHCAYTQRSLKVLSYRMRFAICIASYCGDARHRTSPRARLRVRCEGTLKLVEAASKTRTFLVLVAGGSQLDGGGGRLLSGLIVVGGHS